MFFIGLVQVNLKLQNLILQSNKSNCHSIFIQFTWLHLKVVHLAKLRLDFFLSQQKVFDIGIKKIHRQHFSRIWKKSFFCWSARNVLVCLHRGMLMKRSLSFEKPLLWLTKDHCWEKMKDAKLFKSSVVMPSTVMKRWAGSGAAQHNG